MNISRREFKADRLHDRVLGINLFSDASPVTGEEFQGMVMETYYRDNTAKQQILPGSTLHYGNMSATAKGICLVFALWLVAGPFVCDMAWMVSKVVCIATDFGNEMKTIEMPFVLRAFLAWLGGRELVACRPLVDHTRRLFYNALRVSGWSHMWGNLMKSVAEAVPAWPDIITHLRALCAFLHNTSWRNHIKNMLKGNADLGLKLLDSWTASFIKWRFECVDDVLQQLKPLRPIMEGRVVAEMFGNVQDRVTLDAGIKACRDKDLWCYICAASDLVFRPCEKARHWGMVCDCPEHIRERREDNKKHIACWRNSMRLSGSHEFITKHLAKNKEVIKELVPALCENNPRVTETIRRHLQAKQSGLKLRGKYLGLVPWACSRMDTVAGATEVMKQMRARPLEDHDPLTQMIARTLGGDIERRSQGEDASPAMVKQVAFMKLAKLNEGCGESYHRGTTVELHRAPAAKSDHLKQENRFKQEQQRVRSFLRRHGARARKIVRFEWRCWKRVLQTSWSKRWTPKKLDARQAFKRIYHDDAMANENWSLVVDPERPQRPVITEDNSGDVGLQTEYLGAVFERHGVYEVPQRSTDIGANGELEVNDDTEFFQVLRKRSSHSRPHLMPTFINADEPVLTAALAIEVQPLRRPAEAAGSADQPRDLHTERLYPNTDPYWINGRNIASFEDMAQNMFVWRDVAQSEDAGVIVVSDKQRAKPQCHVLDENCPTLSVIYQIRDEGWRGRPVTTIVDTETCCKRGTTHVRPGDGSRTTRRYMLSTVVCL